MTPAFVRKVMEEKARVLPRRNLSRCKMMDTVIVFSICEVAALVELVNGFHAGILQYKLVTQSSKGINRLTYFQ